MGLWATSGQHTLEDLAELAGQVAAWLKETYTSSGRQISSLLLGKQER